MIKDGIYVVKIISEGIIDIVNVQGKIFYSFGSEESYSINDLILLNGPYTPEQLNSILPKEE